MTKDKMSRPGYLLLSDGSTFRGECFGAVDVEQLCSVGEVVFNTSMTGYQEICTDPSYRGQIMSFTAPHIGNVGCNEQDIESSEVQVEAAICRELSRLSSNYRSTTDFSSYLAQEGKVVLSGVNTRALTTHLRERGAMIGAIGFEQQSAESLRDLIRDFGSMEGKDFVSDVSTKETYSWNELPWDASIQAYPTLEQGALSTRPHVVVIDCGVKRNILRLLLESGFRVTVAPSATSFEELVALKPDGVFFSNGPGDPAALPELVSLCKKVLGKFPLFGICLGQQILSLALGAETFKLKYGHRGANHPVKDLRSKEIYITVQNHGFAVKDGFQSKDFEVSHRNLNDSTVAGVEAPGLNAFAVQFHPEASAGPHDTRFLFSEFFKRVVS